MEGKHEDSKPNWTTHFEILLLGATAVLSGLVSLLDFLGVLDEIPWLTERVSTLTLLAVGLVAGYLVLERRNQLERMHRESLEGVDELALTLAESTETIIQSLKGMELRRFETGNDLMKYVNKRLLQARYQIDDLTWSSALGLEHGLDVTQDLEGEYAERVARVSQRLPYREVFSFNRPGRIRKLKRRLEENEPGYSCAYYEDVRTPLLQFMIIDNDEVVILSDQFSSKLAVKHPHIVRLFAEYYEEIWRNATLIKFGTTVREEIVEEILSNEKPSWNAG